MSRGCRPVRQLAEQSSARMGSMPDPSCARFSSGPRHSYRSLRRHSRLFLALLCEQVCRQGVDLQQ